MAAVRGSSAGVLIPERTSKSESRRHSRNSIVVNPASPQVISSLIETLSAISSPVEESFDLALTTASSQSTPNSPSSFDLQFPRSGSISRITTSPLANGALSHGDQESSISTQGTRSDLLHPRDAQGAQAQRHTGRLSVVRSPSQSSREAAYEEIIDGAYSMGNVSVERMTPSDPAPARSGHRKSLKSLRSARSLRSLTTKRSVDSLKKAEIHLHPIPKAEPSFRSTRLFIPDSPASSAPSAGPSTPKPDDKIDAFDLLHHEQHKFVLQRDNLSQELHLDDDDISQALQTQSRRSSAQFPVAEHIPRRDSSKRHSASFTMKKQRPKPLTSATTDSQAPDLEEDNANFVTPPSTPPPTISADNEASVNRRIEELKEQKANRDRLSVQTETDALPSPGLPSPAGLRPAPGVSSSTEATGSSQAEIEKAASVPSGSASNIHDASNTSKGITELDVLSKSVVSAPNASITREAPTDSASRIPMKSNSKLIRRLSQMPTGPGTERSRRRLSVSGNYPRSNRATLYQNDNNESVDRAVEQYLSSPKLSQKVANPITGRVVSFAEVGDPNGSVIFCCVGMGLTRYIMTFYDELATTLNVRLITPERPGVGESEPHVDGKDTPLSWPDDVRTICEHRGISKFSIMAHSAGAIYALATALRMPQHIRCRVHLLAPWIPPSQLTAFGNQKDPSPAASMPYSQRLLRSLPATFLRAANSNFLSLTSNRITTSLPRSPRRSRRHLSRSFGHTPENDSVHDGSDTSSIMTPTTPLHDKENRPPLRLRQIKPNAAEMINLTDQELEKADKEARRTTYEARLASAIWDASTKNANPAVDLLVCLERHQPIGFRYVDITRAVVIHHGSKDSRVPVENVKRLGNEMRKCEVRVLEGEGHGLMANASIMGNVLMEMAGEWDDWNRVVAGDKKKA